jgi:hypothetical protein
MLLSHALKPTSQPHQNSQTRSSYVATLRLEKIKDLRRGSLGGTPSATCSSEQFPLCSSSKCFQWYSGFLVQSAR